MRTPTKDILKKMGESVTLMGWVHIRRDHGKLIFIDLRDRWGIVQIVFSPKNEALLKEADRLRSEYVITVEGVVRERPQGMQNPELATGMFEVEAQRLWILSEAEQPLPIAVAGAETEPPALDTRMDWRWLDLRKQEHTLIFQIWTTIENAFRRYCLQEDFIEIHSPKFMEVPSESGAELFEVNYFDRKAYLAQSPQFYKQMAMAAGFERVFEIGPVFRAEPSFTSRHATEFTGYDLEMSFIESEEDIMQALEEIMVSMLEAARDHYGKELEKIYQRILAVPSLPFPRISMEEAKKMLSSGGGAASERGGDLNPEEERRVSSFIKERYGHEFVFVTRYPAAVRPFYHMRQEGDSELTKSFDLLWDGIELATGAQREHRYDRLLMQAKEKGIHPESLQTYLNFFKYGCPPHGGFGFGPGRMMMKIMGLENIREVTYLYRGVKRLSP